MLEEVELAENKPVKENHVIGFVDRKDQDKTQKEFFECVTISESVPDGNRSHTQYHQDADDHQHPTHFSGAIEQLIVPWFQNCQSLFRG